MGQSQSRATDPQTLSDNYAAFERDKAEFGVQSIAQKKHKGTPSAYFDKRTGGYYVLQEGHNFQPHEVEAAKILAKNGICVVMQPESEKKGGVSLRLSSKGSKTFPEGKIGALWYEQLSSKLSSHDEVKDALVHAHRKGASVAVLFCYAKHIQYGDITRGAKQYYGQSLEQKRVVEKLIVIARRPRGKGFEIIEKDIIKP